MARDKDGASALSALVGFLTVTTIMGSASMFLGFDATKVDTEHPAFAAGAIGNKNVFFGILVGCVAGALYNKFGKTKLPDFLAFFSGRRCVPILTAAVMSIISLLLLFIWPAVYGALVWFGESIMGLGAVGAMTSASSGAAPTRPVARSSPPAASTRSACTSPASTRPASSRS